MTEKDSIAAMFRRQIAALDARDHSRAARLGGWFLCPCCRYPTLTSRETYEVCPLCLWEDDGHDDIDADALPPDSPNGRSLTAARRNFADHFDQFDAGAGPKPVAAPTKARRNLLAYVARVQAGERLGLEPFHTLLAACDD